MHLRGSRLGIIIAHVGHFTDSAPKSLAAVEKKMSR